MLRPISFAFLMALCTAVTGLRAETAMPVSFSEVTDLAVTEDYQTVRYGDAPSQFAELWLPDHVPAPGIVLVHGGCWLSQYGVDHIRPLASALAQQGYVVWAPEYRRVGEPGGGWPGTFHDIAVAIEAFPEAAAAALDADRIAYAGHSAGGHLALWAAARQPGSDSSPAPSSVVAPKAVLGLAAITDLESYARGDNSCQQVVVDLMEGLPEEHPERYRNVSPARLTYPAPPVLIQGEADPIVPAAQAAAIVGAKRVSIPDAGHFDVIHPDTAAFAVLLNAIGEALAP